VRCLGLDISVTRTGLAVCSVEDDKLTLEHNDSIKVPEKKGINRAHKIAARVADAIIRYEPNIVSIEGYAFGNRFSLATLVEVGTLVRWAVFSSGLFYIDPSPKSLKKFVTTSGNADKKMMMAHVLKNWGIKASNHDEADAIGLAAMGLAYTRALKVAGWRRDILMSCKKHSLATRD